MQEAVYLSRFLCAIKEKYMEGIKGKIVLVTGANKGIGKSIAQNFLEEGATVIVAGGSDTAATEKTVAEFKALGPVEGYTVDMSDFDAVEKMVDYVAEKYGRIDVLVNNAGINIRNWATEFDMEAWDKVLAVNLRSYFVAARTAARYMKEQGGGSIVCISSGNSAMYTTKRSAYNTSKAAVNGLVGALAVEWARFGIRVNGVAPGYVLTDMVKHGIEEGIIDVDAIMPMVPMKRFLDPREIARPVVFLASSEASGVTGQVLFSDAGWKICGLPEDKDF